MMFDTRSTELCDNEMEICCASDDVLPDPDAKPKPEVAKSGGFRNFKEWNWFSLLVIIIIKHVT